MFIENVTLVAVYMLTLFARIDAVHKMQPFVSKDVNKGGFSNQGCSTIISSLQFSDWLWCSIVTE